MERVHGVMVELSHSVPEHVRQQHIGRYFSTVIIRATVKQLLEIGNLRLYSYNNRRLSFKEQD